MRYFAAVRVLVKRNPNTPWPRQWRGRLIQKVLPWQRVEAFEAIPGKGLTERLPGVISFWEVAG